MSRTVLVIFGGVSNENEISVITGTMACNVLKSGGDKVIPVYISQKGDIYAGQSLADISTFKGDGYKNSPHAVIADGGVYIFNKRGKIKKHVKADVALNCCHGGVGEGGGISGVCALANLPLAAAQIFESSVFMDKYFTKLVLCALGVKTLDFVRVESLDEVSCPANMPEFPLIVKPATLGSSIGIQKADDFGELKRAVEVALMYDSSVIIEKFVTGRREINCAAYLGDGIVVSECEEAISGGDFLSFEDKYEGGGRSVLPADIPAAVSNKIKNTTRFVYGKLNMRGIVRFDYILSGNDVYLSEVNTVPGSLSYYLLSNGFKQFYHVLSAVITRAEDDFARARQKKLLHTGILENIPANACKLGRK